MPERAPYPNAPITEAVLDIRVQLPPDVGLRDLLRTHEGEAGRYPQQETQIFHEFEHKSDGTHRESHEETGYRFRSANTLDLYQARFDGFTMNRLAPYEHWENFRTEARRLWGVYRRCARPSRITRLGVRYLNRIDMPLPVHDFADYLRTLPQVPAELPQQLATYFMQLTMPIDAIRTVAVLNENLTEPARAGVASVVLDIELFRVLAVPQDEDGIWSFMEELRTWKNRLFEGSITNKARELFQ